MCVCERETRKDKDRGGDTKSERVRGGGRNNIIISLEKIFFRCSLTKKQFFLVVISDRSKYNILLFYFVRHLQEIVVFIHKEELR